MTFTEEELLVWTVDKLKNYLTTRGVTVSGGGGRKADLIRKVLAADLPPVTYFTIDGGQRKRNN